MKKPRDELASLEFWDLKTPVVPSHSRLYSLEPCGLGTPYVESLTSYISRLAQAHSVILKNLMHEEIFPALRDTHLLRIGPTNLNSFLKEAARAINSTGIIAGNFVSILESLTLRTELRSLTMLPWRSVLAQTGLLKPTRAWCPDCLADWHSAQEAVYEPLFWHISPISLCLYHQKPLVKQCPYSDCSSIGAVSAGSFRPGYCSKCFRWLGFTDHSMDTSSTIQDWKWQIWASKTVGQLLSYNIDLRMSPHLGNIPNLVAAYLDQAVDGNKTKMTQYLSISRKAFKDWELGVRVPQLGTLLRLCYCCGISILDLLTLQSNQLHQIKLKIHSRPDVPELYQQRRPKSAFDAFATQKTLETIFMSEEEPASMRTIAKYLNKDPRQLRKHFPSLCHAISMKYKDYRKNCSKQSRQRMEADIRQAVKEIHLMGQYPTYEKVRSRASISLSLRYDLFIKFWREAVQELKQEHLING